MTRPDVADMVISNTLYAILLGISNMLFAVFLEYRAAYDSEI